MNLRRLLRGLLPPEFQALAEKIESLDPTSDSDARSWLVLNASGFLRNNEGLRWYERRILEMETTVHFRAMAKHDAMALVMRVPLGDEKSWDFGRTKDELLKGFPPAPMPMPSNIIPKVTIRRKDRYSV